MGTLSRIAYGNGTELLLWDRSTAKHSHQPLIVVKTVDRRADPAQQKLTKARLRHEIETLRTLKHENIVRIYGFTPSYSQFTMEHCDCSLERSLKILKSLKQKRLEPTTTLRFCTDILKALDYLHTKAFILHGDLKSLNVLVKGNYKTFKLCDFDVSVRTDKNGIYNQANRPSYFGTPLWSAPEVLGRNALISTKADIFSFGLIIYETLTLAYPHTLNNGNIQPAQPLSIPYGKRPNLPITFSSSLNPVHRLVIETFFACTNSNPRYRPSAKEALQYIYTGGKTGEYSIPPAPNRGINNQFYDSIILFYNCEYGLLNVII